MKAVLLIVLFISLLSFANEFTQTDWSGGGGVEGPVPSWGNTFFEANNIFFENTTLILGIGAFLENPISQIIADSLPNSNSLVCGDIDNDGDIDVIGTGQKEGQVVWYENVGGTGNSWNTNVIAVHDSSDYYVIELVVTDMDCDGDLDVIGGIGDGASSSELSWWENLDGSGTAWAEHEDFVDYYCSPIYTGDIDNDGDVDLLANYYSPEDDTGVWLENENGLGTQWTVHNIVEDIECFKYAYVADIDGDGDMDVLSSYRNPYPLSHFVSWWENVDGSGISWIEHVVYESDEDAFSVYAADLDDDGDIDLIGSWYNQWDDEVNGEIICWENVDGSSTSWTEHTISESGVMSIGAVDLDGDGDIDIYGSRGLRGFPSGPFDAILICENTNGSCDSWTTHSFFSEMWDYAIIWPEILAADINVDGKLEFIWAGAHVIFSWDFMGFADTGTLESSILDTDEFGEWDLFTAAGSMPPGTSVSFQFRSSQDYNNMGAWSDVINSTDISLTEILDDSTMYLQYKVLMETSAPEVSPELQGISFEYLQAGVEESESSSWSLSIAENPSYSLFSALVSVPEAGLVELFLYDVSGRVVAEISEELPSGTHSVDFTGLTTGVYFCTMSDGEFSATERVVVLR